MSETANLAIPFITATQNQKEVTHSSGMARLDAAITETLTVSLSSGNVTLTQAQVREAALIEITGATTAGRTLTLPSVKRPILVRSSGANSDDVDIVRGTTTLTISPDEGFFVYIGSGADDLTLLFSSSGTGGGGGGGGGGGSGPFALDDGTAVAGGVFSFDDGTAA